MGINFINALKPGVFMSVAVLDDIEETVGALFNPPEEVSDVDHTMTYLACQFFGLVGGHNFYAGKPLYGIVNLLSLSFSFVSFIAGVALTTEVGPLLVMAGIANGARQWISWQIDKYRIATGTFEDGEGKQVRQFARIPKEKVSDKDHKLAYFCNLFFGELGGHAFYAERSGKGIAMFVVMSLCGYGIPWSMMDQYSIVTGSFKDGEGKTICPPYMQSK